MYDSVLKGEATIYDLTNTMIDHYTVAVCESPENMKVDRRSSNVNIVTGPSRNSVDHVSYIIWQKISYSKVALDHVEIRWSQSCGPAVILHYVTVWKE